MAQPWRQRDLDSWQRGLDIPIARVRSAPAHLAEHLGIAFTESPDDLDFGTAALLESESGKQFALVEPRKPTEGETAILANRFSQDLSRDLDEILSALGFTRDDLTWTHPAVTEPRWALWREDDNGNRIAMRVFALRVSAEFAKAEYEAKGHKQTYWVEPARDALDDAKPWTDPAVEFPLWEVWRGDRSGTRRRLDLVDSRVRAEELLIAYRAEEPAATFWTAPHRWSPP